MLTIFFIMIVLAIVWKMIVLAVKATWGITKILFSIVFLPVILIGMALAGLYVLAVPILVIVGIVVLIEAIV